MKNILLRVAYDGTDFAGYQEQPGKRSVSGVLRDAVETVTGRTTRLIAAGRTDRGVHAEEQAVNFLTSLTLSDEAFYHVLQNQLPEDVVLCSATSVPLSFHARFTPHVTTYRYTVENAPLVLPTERRTVFSYTFPLAVEPMQAAIKCFEGDHDFSAFSSASPHRNARRRLLYAEVTKSGSRYCFRFSAESFLQYQVRMMVGAVLLAGRGVLTREAILTALSVHHAKPVAFSADAKGLVLESVAYSTGYASIPHRSRQEKGTFYSL